MMCSVWSLRGNSEQKIFKNEQARESLMPADRVEERKHPMGNPKQVRRRERKKKAKNRSVLRFISNKQQSENEVFFFVFSRFRKH